MTGYVIQSGSKYYNVPLNTWVESKEQSTIFGSYSVALAVARLLLDRNNSIGIEKTHEG